MICWKTISFSGVRFNQAWGSVYESDAQNLGATPATFITTPTIFANNGSGATAWLEGITDTSTTQFGQTYFVRPVSGPATFSINIMAIGRWK